MKKSSILIFFCLLFNAAFGSLQGGLLSIHGTQFSNCKMFQFPDGVLYKLYWSVVSNQISVGLEADVSHAAGWLGIGIQTTSTSTRMQNADIVIGFPNNGSPTVFNYNGPSGGNGAPSLSGTQIVTLLNSSSINGVYGIEFRRSYANWNAGTLIYAMNENANVQGSSDGQVSGLSYHTRRNFLDSFSFDTSSTSCELPGSNLDVDCPNATLSSVPLGRMTNLTFSNFQVPSTATSYMCTVVNLPLDQKYHAVRFDPIVINPSVVHHMIVYVCDNPVTDAGVFNCANMKSGCVSVFYAWAVGAPSFCLPSIAGMPFGQGTTRKNFVLQIHYNNPSQLAGIVDHSGVSITYTTSLREKEAGLIRLGVPINKISIPAGQSSYEMSDTCPSSSTKALKSPMTVFGVLFHAHKYGRKIWTEQFRGGQSIGYIGHEMNFDFNAQKITKLAPYPEIQAGDSLTTHCVWDTSSSSKTIKGGESSDDEMCFNFLAYYPLIEADTCGSSKASRLGVGAIIGIVVASIVILVVFIVIIVLVVKKRGSHQRLRT